MIKDSKPISMAEVKEILKDQDSEKAKTTLAFIKRFVKLSEQDAKTFFESVKKLDISKLKDEDIIKIMDFMPEDAEDLRKIFAGSSINLEQDEITKILELRKK
jgi:DNA-directed RNA polymerase subunit F